MSFAWPTHISWQQHVAKPIPTLRSDIQKLEATTRANKTQSRTDCEAADRHIFGDDTGTKCRYPTRSDPMTVFPKNPSFVAALNRSKTVTVRTLSPATNPAVYVMQRNMFERVKTTGNGCLSCRGNK